MNNDQSTFLAKTQQGLEGFLAEELKALGAQNIVEGRRSVEFEGDQFTLYRVLLASRFALRILKPIFTFRAQGPDSLYKHAVRLNWGKHVNPHRSLVLHVTAYSDHFPHDRFAMYRLKDAMQDHFRDRGKGHLDIDRDNPEQIVHLHISGEDVTVSLDAAGTQPLFKRGYRPRGARAPLNEVLTAGLLAMAGWKPGEILIDPMCGAGTFSMEAALWTAQTPVNWNRQDWACHLWSDFHEGMWDAVRKELLPQHIEKAPILASDNNEFAVGDAKEAARDAGVEHLVRIGVEDFLHMYPPRDVEPGLIVLNPPYGERIREDQLEALYRKIGQMLKFRWAGWRAAVLVPEDLHEAKQIGLKHTARFKVFNGPLACNWSVYDLFDGKRADKLSSATSEPLQPADESLEAATPAAPGITASTRKRGTRPRIQPNAPLEGEED
jgi:putative N6-adenine-specific DNA methylase